MLLRSCGLPPALPRY